MTMGWVCNYKQSFPNFVWWIQQIYANWDTSIPKKEKYSVSPLFSQVTEVINLLKLDQILSRIGRPFRKIFYIDPKHEKQDMT